MFRDIVRLIRAIVRRKTAENFLRYNQARAEWLHIRASLAELHPDLLGESTQALRAFFGPDNQ